MGLIELALAPLRAVIGGAEHEAEHVLPVRDIEEIQARALDTAESIKRATESIESHVRVVETLATSLEPLAQSIGPLTEAVAALTHELASINEVLAPLAGAERDLTRVEHLFGRRKRP
jgi:methyl-accepting chemotaxis protein